MHELDSEDGRGNKEWSHLIGGPPSLEDKIYERIKDAKSFRESDLKDLRPAELNDHVWRKTIWSVTQRLLGEGVFFSPSNGVYRRATRVNQGIGRSSRFKSAALRKMERAVKIVAATRAFTDDPEELRQIERLALKSANAIVNARAALRGAGLKRPKGI